MTDQGSYLAKKKNTEAIKTMQIWEMLGWDYGFRWSLFGLSPQYVIWRVFRTTARGRFFSHLLLCSITQWHKSNKGNQPLSFIRPQPILHLLAGSKKYLQQDWKDTPTAWRSSPPSRPSQAEGIGKAYCWSAEQEESMPSLRWTWNNFI